MYACTRGRMEGGWTRGRMYACTHGRVDAWTRGRVDAWTHGRVDAWTRGRVDAWPFLIVLHKGPSDHNDSDLPDAEVGICDF